METQSRVAGSARRSGFAALGLVVLGPLLSQVPGVPPLAGFYTFGLGLLTGLVALVTGLAGLWFTRPASGAAGRGSAGIGVGVGVAIIAVVVIVNAQGLGGPPINDITTDTKNPPQFAAIAKLLPERDYSYPGGEFTRAQIAAYPDLRSIVVSLPPDQALVAAKETAEALGWDLVFIDTEAYRIEAIETTTVFRFVDDVVISIRPAAEGSRIDVRSKSRDGRGDVGANAARIRRFRSAVSDG